MSNEQASPRPRSPNKPVAFILKDLATGAERLFMASCETDVREAAHSVTKATTEDVMRLAQAGVALETVP